MGEVGEVTATPEEFALIADSAPVPMWVTRPDRKRSFVNRAYVAFLGVSYEEALAFDWRTILHPDDADRIVQESISGEAGLETFTLEGRYRRGDGKWRWLQSISQPRRDGDGNWTGFIGVAHDVTDAREAEQRVRQREQQLSALVDQTTAGLAQVDLTGRFTYVNDRFCAIVGRGRDALLATSMQAITHPEDLPRNLPLFEEAVRSGTSYNHEKRYVRPDGSSVWVSNAVAVIRRTGGVPYGVLAVTSDITTRRAAEDALKRSEESVRLAVESAGMATWELDPATMRGPWSRSRFDLLGYPPTSDLCGTFEEWLERVHPDDLHRVRASAMSCLSEGESFSIDYRIIRADTGEIRWLQSHGSRAESGRRGDARFVGVSFDITATKRAAEATIDNERQLRFLDTLSTTTATALDSDEVLSATTRMLAEHIGVAVCAYADMEPDENSFHIRGDWHRSDVRSIVGTYHLSPFGTAAVEKLKAGEPLVIDDADVQLGGDTRAAFASLGIRATLCMPLVKQGRLSALMAVHDAAPRRWTEGERRLLREVAERSWAHIERVRSEAALRLSEQRLRLAVEGAKIGTWDWDLTTSVGAWSDRTAEIMGVTVRDNLTPDIRFSLIHPDDSERVRAEVRDAIASGEVFSTEYRVRRPDGAVLWVASRGVVSFGEHGRAVRLTGTIRDVTSRRNAQEQLHALNRSLEQRVAERTAERDRMWRLSGDLLLVVDDRWRIRAANPASRALLGYEPDELAGRRLRSFVHPADWKDARGALRQGAHESVRDFNARLLGSDGTARSFSWAAAPGEGEAYVIGRDVTAEVERRRELEQAQETIRQAQKVESIGQLTGGVAHDFNNLLTPIVGNLDLLGRRLSGDRELRLVRSAAEAAERARTLVQRLLAFARRQPLRPGPVDVAGLITGMDELIATTCGPQIRLIVDVPSDLPHAVADRNQLEMALLNLSVNSRDAMSQGGTLRIGAALIRMDGEGAKRAADVDFVRIRVCDTGIGMDAATIDRAVEPFFSTKEIGKGTGLGLSMVHGLALQLGGRLEVASEVGVGTTVDLYLPATEDVAVDQRRGSRAGRHLAGRTVLVVDDEAPVRATTSSLLRELGFVVSEATSAEEALRMISSSPPDLVVTDHLMPGMTGAELAKKLQLSHPDVGILLVSGYTDLVSLSADIPRLSKPFGLEDLELKLQRLG